MMDNAYYDVNAIRQAFEALQTTDDKGQLPLFFDGPGGSQVPKSVLQALIDYLGKCNSNMGGYAYAGIQTTKINQEARKQVGIWLNCPSDNVVFGLNSTSLMFMFARSIARTWQAGNNVVVSSIDHFSNVSSWTTACEECSAYGKPVSVRTIPLVADASRLDLSALDALIDQNTKLVAVSLASNVLGTKTDIHPIIAKARSVGALVVIDAVHAAVHQSVDVASLGCDLLFASSYKLGGSHLGMAYASNRVLGLQPYKVKPASDMLPSAWEQGTQSFEGQAAMIALVAYWAALSQKTPDTPLKDRLRHAYAIVEQHEQMLSELFLEYANNCSYIRLYGSQNPTGRTPTFAFNLIKNGSIIPPSHISQWLGFKNVALPHGNFYALDVARQLGLLKTGFLRAGFLHYTTPTEVMRLFELLEEYIQNET